jgi:ribosome-associated protein
MNALLFIILGYKGVPMLSHTDVVEHIYKALDDKKAQDITIMDVSKITTLADYFIIATGTSSTHINALCHHVEKELAKEGFILAHKEGYVNGDWVLLDYHDFVIHVFNSELRAYYSLERIWSDAKFIELG